MSARGADEGRVRAFLAVELGDEARACAVATSVAMREGPGGDSVRWSRSEALHVTLRFLGDVPLEPVAGVDDEGNEVATPGVGEIGGRVAAEVAASGPFTLRLGEPIAFPSKRAPRVVALDLVPHAPLEALASSVERAVVALGFEPERRAFRPHVTLGRLRRGARPSEARPLFDFNEEDEELARVETEASFSVDEVVLFRSELKPTGSVHTALERISLSGPRVVSGDSVPHQGATH